MKFGFRNFNRVTPFNRGGRHDDLPGGDIGVTAGQVVMRHPLTKKPHHNVGHFSRGVVVLLALSLSLIHI